MEGEGAPAARKIGPGGSGNLRSELRVLDKATLRMLPSWKILRADMWVFRTAFALLVLAKRSAGRRGSYPLLGQRRQRCKQQHRRRALAWAEWAPACGAAIHGLTGPPMSPGPTATTPSFGALCRHHFAYHDAKCQQPCFKTNGYVLQGSTVNLAGSSVTVDTGAASITSIVTGTTGLVKNGGGALHLSNVANTLQRRHNGQRRRVGHRVRLLGRASGVTQQLTSRSTTAARCGTTPTVCALNVNRQMLLGTGGGIINTNGFNGGFAGVISGSSFTKTGAGTLTLTNNNTYTGGTTIIRRHGACEQSPLVVAPARGQ